MFINQNMKLLKINNRKPIKKDGVQPSMGEIFVAQGKRRRSAALALSAIGKSSAQSCSKKRK